MAVVVSRDTIQGEAGGGELPQGLTIRREWLPNGWQLVSTGPEAKGMMIERVMEEIERMYGPG